MRVRRGIAALAVVVGVWVGVGAVPASAGDLCVGVFVGDIGAGVCVPTPID